MLSKTLTKMFKQIDMFATTEERAEGARQLRQQLEMQAENHSCFRCSNSIFGIKYGQEKGDAFAKFSREILACRLGALQAGEDGYGLYEPDAPFFCSGEENLDLRGNDGF